jgi:hypothetical protein
MSLVDGQMTRQVLHAITQQIQTLSMLTVSGQLINVAFTAMTFRVILKRLDALAQDIETLSETVRAEFDRDRDMRFKIALQAARDVFESDSELTRQEASRTAIDGLFEARENFLTDFKTAIQHEDSREHLQMAHHYLLRAMYAEISRVRCYAASGEMQLAKTRLSEDMDTFQEHTNELIERWLGVHPAIYFHHSVSTEDVARFFHIRQWQAGIRRENNPQVMFDVIDQLRRDFWDTDLIEDEYHTLLNRVTRRPAQTMEDRVVRLSSNLGQAEIVMENFDRLRGLQLEMRSMRLSLENWSNLVSRDDLETHGAALIIDSDRLMQEAS